MAKTVVWAWLTSLHPEMSLLAHCSTYNTFFMDLPVSSSVFPPSLLTAKHVNLAVAHDGLLSLWKLSTVAF